MKFQVRDFLDSDTPLALALYREHIPEMVVNEAILRHWDSTMPERAKRRRWVGVADGQPMAVADAELDPWKSAEGVSSLWVGVSGPFRGSGYGKQLYGVAEDYLRSLQVRKIGSHSSVRDERSERFLTDRGFEKTRADRLWVLEPGTADLSGFEGHLKDASSKGFQPVPLGSVRHMKQELYEVYAAAARDIPDDEPMDDLRYEDWESEIYDHPALSDEGSYVIMKDERPVAFTMVVVDTESKRADHELTGTHPEFRRMGLARLAKEATARWAQNNEIRLITANDSTNTDMLSINEHMGYRPVPGYIRYSKST